MVFDNAWFGRHQKKILWFANSFIGRLVFGFKGMGHELEKGVPIIKITPHSVAQYVWFQNRIQIREHFFGRPMYAIKLRFWLYPLWFSLHILDLLFDNFASQFSFGFSTLTVNPDAASGATTVDGQVGVVGGVSRTWTQIRSDAGNIGNFRFVSTGNRYLFRAIGSVASDTFDTLERSIFTFDTSALTANATISVATISFYGNAKRDDNSNGPTAQVVGATPAVNNNLADADYAQLGSTAFSTAITVAGWNTAGYNDFVLNASGLANISKTGISRFGGIEGAFDLTGTDPGTLTNGGTYDFQIYFADNGSNMPKLVITYTTTINYTLTAAQGSYTLTGIAATFHVAYHMTAAKGAYVLTGIASILRYGRTMVAAQGSYVLTGINAAFQKALHMTAAQGTYTLTGIATAFKKALHMTASMGSYSLTGIAAILRTTVWGGNTKNNANWTDPSKNSSNWTDPSKNSSNWTFPNKD